MTETYKNATAQPILSGKEIPVNNGRQVLITLTPGGLTFRTTDSTGRPESELTMDDGEIIAAYNLLQYMKSHDLRRAYVSETNDSDAGAVFTDFSIFK